MNPPRKMNLIAERLAMRRLYAIVVLAFVCGTLPAQTNNASLGLVIVQIKPIPFRVMYKGDSPRVSLPVMPVSHPKVGDKVKGYTVVAVTTTNLSLEMNGRTNIFEKGRTVPRDEYEVTFSDATNGTNFVVQSGVEFDWGTRTLKIAKVSGSGVNCWLKDQKTGAEFKVEEKVNK